MIIRPKSILPGLTGLLFCMTTLALGVPPASAVEQCRFIQGKTEREACYARQEAGLAAKRSKPEPKRDAAMESLQQMKQEDAELNRQIHGICRGC